MNFWMTLIREIFRGKSLLRSVENLAFTQVRVSGKILDVAGGGRKRRPSYRRFIQSSPDSEWTMADYDQTSRPDLCFDANRCWPIADESFDTVMIINSLHIFQHPESVLQQAARVLRPQGRLLVTAPLIFNE
jgi:SAM-dependent methyltransferase